MGVRRGFWVSFSDAAVFVLDDNHVDTGRQSHGRLLSAHRVDRRPDGAILAQFMDPLLSLAFAMHSTRGAYALLLGSGVSRAAAIPTGWEVVIDLVRKLAAMRGEVCDPDPESWFHDVFGEAPTYSDLLKKLCRTQAERQQLLRSYFETSADEEASGQRQPTKAHRAVAALAKSGHVRVILTTNFDRLIERSLEAAGVSPVVISTAHAVDGAMPLVHSPCTVVKLHGDYLDARIRNTPEELAKYDRRIDRLLDRIFDDFGLVVCGWSADWDHALRDAVSRCKSRRFTTYWALKGEPSEAASRLIRHRIADVIRISDADQFFDELQQKSLSLASFDPPHPLSAKTAAATMKRLLSDERHRIELHDLVMNEVERVMSATSDSKMPVSGPVSASVLQQRMGVQESVSTILVQLLALGCRWGTDLHHDLWRRAVERLANWPLVGGSTVLISMRMYPALLAMYAGGIAAIVGERYDTLRVLLLGCRVGSPDGEQKDERPVSVIYPQALLDQPAGQAFLLGMRDRRTPFCDYLFDLVRDPLRDLLPDERAYERTFDRFEYLAALVYADLQLTAGNDHLWVPPGRFTWKHRFGRVPEVIDAVGREAQEAGTEWEPIRAGLFASLERFKLAETRVGTFVAKYAR
jgi:hypothetical protein